MMRQRWWAGAATTAVLLACGRSPVEIPEVELVPSPSFLRFVARVGESVPAQPIALGDARDLSVAWRASAEAAWLVLDMTRGQVPAVLHVGVRTRELAPGTHRAAIVIEPESEAAGARGASVVVELVLSAPGWESLGGPGCGVIDGVGVDPVDPTLVLAGQRYAGLWLSRDGGATFARTSADVHWDAVARSFAFTSDGTIYAGLGRKHGAANGGVLRSQDHGNSWAMTPLQNVGAAYVAVDVQNEALVLAADPQSGVWRSADGGDTWSVQAFPSVARVAIANPGGPGFILGGDGGTIYRSPDGETFTAVATGLGVEWSIISAAGRPDGTILALGHLDCCSDLLLVRSTDAGQTWGPVAGVGLQRYGIYDLDERLGSDTQAFYFTGAELLVSLDAGESWSTVPRTGRASVGDGWLLAVAPHPQGPIVGTRGSGVLRQQGGALAPARIEACEIWDLDYEPGTGSLFAAAWQSGVWRRSAAGAWDGAGGDGLWPVELVGVSADPRNGQVLIALGENDRGVFRSDDGGLSWTANPTGLNHSAGGGKVVRAPDDPEVIWVAGAGGGLFRSTDNGLSFAQISGEETRHVAVVSREVVVADSNRVSRHDLDAGSSQVVIDLDSHTRVLAAGGGRVYWVSDSGETHRSTDGGLTFARTDFIGDYVHDLAPHPTDPDRVFIATESGLFESRDGLASWEEKGAPFEPRALEWGQDAAVLYVGTVWGGVYAFTPDP